MNTCTSPHRHPPARDILTLYLLNILGQVSRIANPTYALQPDCPKFLSRYLTLFILLMLITRE